VAEHNFAPVLVQGWPVAEHNFAPVLVQG